MTTMLKPWDVVEHLDSEEAIVAYLDAALEEADPRLILAALSDIARARGRSEIVNALSVETNVLSGSGSSTTPSDIVTILKTIHSLGLSLHVSPMAAE